MFNWHIHGNINQYPEKDERKSHGKHELKSKINDTLCSLLSHFETLVLPSSWNQNMNSVK